MRRINSWLRPRPQNSHGGRFKRRRPSQLAFTVETGGNTLRSILRSALTLYCLLVITLGLVIPISDALATAAKHSGPLRQIFYILMVGAGVFSVLYLSCLISWHQRVRRNQLRARLLTASERRTCSIEEIQQEEEEEDDMEERNDENEDDDDVIAVEGDVEFRSTETQPLVVQFQLSPLPAEKDKEEKEKDKEEKEKDKEEKEKDKEEEEKDKEEEEIDEEKDKDEEEKAAKVQVHYEEFGPQLAPEASCLPQVTERRPKPKVKARARANRRGRWLPWRRRAKRRSWQEQEVEIPKIFWRADGINLYLRLGAIVFGFGVMTHDGFRIVEFLSQPGDCHSWLFMPKQLLHLLFIMLQTYFVFKYHRVTFNTQKAVARFLLVHLLATNLCIWIKAVVHEIKVGLSHGARIELEDFGSVGRSGFVSNFSSNGSRVNITGSGDCPHSYQEDAPSQKLGPYLYPCAVEYGLICAAVSFKFFRSVGNAHQLRLGSRDTSADSGDIARRRQQQPSMPRFTTCHKSHKGLFFGLVVMMVVLVPLISLVFVAEGSGHSRVFLLTELVVECAVLLLTLALSAVGSFRMIRRLSFSRVRGNEAFEVNLLLVGMAGIVCYNLFVAMATVASELDGEGQSIWTGELRMAQLNGFKAALEILQTLCQTFFIMQGIQRKVNLRLLQNLQKPGRGITIALLIANLAMWLVSVFDVKKNASQRFMEKYFGPMPWDIIKYICLPLIIFYRFHSTICLSEIWIHSYKLSGGETKVA